jgi:hypothetical protein
MIIAVEKALDPQNHYYLISRSNTSNMLTFSQKGYYNKKGKE